MLLAGRNRGGVHFDGDELHAVLLRLPFFQPRKKGEEPDVQDVLDPFRLQKLIIPVSMWLRSDKNTVVNMAEVMERRAGRRLILRSSRRERRTDQQANKQRLGGEDSLQSG